MRKYFTVLFLALATLSNVASGATTKEIGAGVPDVVVDLTDASTVTWDASAGTAFRLVIGGNRLMATPTSQTPGKIYTLAITQDGTGNRVPTWSDDFRFTATVPPTLTTTANAIDILTFLSDGTNMQFLTITKNLMNGVTMTAPSNFTATPSGSEEVDFAWTDNSNNETGFVIQQEILGNWETVETVGANVTSLEAGPGYTPGLSNFRVRASANGGLTLSAPSNEDTADIAP